MGDLFGVNLKPANRYGGFKAPDITTIFGYRDRTIMEVLYSTAIRRNELRILKVSDVNLEEKLLHVFGKGQKERMVPFVTPVQPT